MLSPGSWLLAPDPRLLLVGGSGGGGVAGDLVAEGVDGLEAADLANSVGEVDRELAAVEVAVEVEEVDLEQALALLERRA